MNTTTTPAITVEPIYAEGRPNNGAWNAHAFRITTEAGIFTIARDGADALRVEMGSHPDEVVGIFSAIGMRQQAHNWAASVRRHEMASQAVNDAASKGDRAMTGFEKMLNPSQEELDASIKSEAAYREVCDAFAPLKAVADAVTAAMNPSALDRG